MARRTVVVTGGTGALGSAVVEAFRGDGDRVVMPWIVPAEREAAERRFKADLAAGALELVEADLSDAAGAATLARAAGRAGVLVNVAGGFEGGSPVHETPLEVWDRLYRMNLRTAVATSRALIPGMLAAGGGVIVNVASQAAWSKPATLAAYSASKAGVIVLTETLQRELGPRGVRVCAVAPSTIDTPANRAAMPDADFSSWTPPERIASVIRWLACADAAATGGAIIPV